MHLIYVVLIFLPLNICLDIETALFEVPIKGIGEEIQKLKDIIKYQKDKCVNPPSMEWCDNNAVKHKGWHAESDFGIAICASTIWTRTNHYNGLAILEQELDVITLTFEAVLISLEIDTDEIISVEKEIAKDSKKTPTFRTINHPKLVDDNGFQVAKDEIQDIFGSGEKMIKDFEDGNYADMIFTFFKQIKQTVSLLFKKRDGENKIGTSDAIAWLYGNTMLNVSNILNHTKLYLFNFNNVLKSQLYYFVLRVPIPDYLMKSVWLALK